MDLWTQGGAGRGTNCNHSNNINMTTCNTDSGWEAAVSPGGSAGGSVRTQRVGGGGREGAVQEGGDVCVHTANSRGCAAETNTTL